MLFLPGIFSRNTENRRIMPCRNACDPRGTTGVHAGEVAPENKDLIVAEFRDTVGDDALPDHSNHTAAHPNQYLDRGRYDRRRTSRYVQTNEQRAITRTAVGRRSG